LLILSEDKAICEPFDSVRYTAQNRKVSVDALKVPERLIITYQRSTYECAKNLIDGKCVEWLYGEAQPFCVGLFKGVEIGVGRFWIGAPTAAFTFEEAIVCGAKAVFEVGLSGGLQTFLQPGNVVVVTEAIRDEGTSYHYFPPKVKMQASAQLRKKLVKRLGKRKTRHFIGSVWSTDGVYRETREKFRRFRDSGVLAVNMETSAIFAVAKYRNVQAASTQVISDVFSENGWLQAFHHQSVRKNTKALLKAVLETLAES
jgi:uridine phosphorylase